jgi:hypothetical protein
MSDPEEEGDDRFSLHAAFESGQSDGGTEDNRVGPVTPSPGPTSGTILLSKATGVDFSHTVSSGSVDLDDEE